LDFKWAKDLFALGRRMISQLLDLNRFWGILERRSGPLNLEGRPLSKKNKKNRSDSES